MKMAKSWTHLLVAVVLFALLWTSSRWPTASPGPEPFSVHFKVDAEPMEVVNEGAKMLIKGVKQHSDNLRDTALAFVPFKERFRKMHRDLRRKIM
jgi:hypothetical protein